MSNVTFIDALEMTTVTFSDGSSITGRVTSHPHGGFSIQHVVARAPVLTLFVEYEEME
jgi:hypothetical protein